MRCSKSRYYSDLELAGTFEKSPKASFSNVPIYDKEASEGLLKYSMRLDDGRKLKSSRMMILYLELPKFTKKSDEPVEKLTTVEKWAKFFLYADCAKKSDYIRKLAESEEGIMYAQRTLDSISQSDAEWRRERDYIDAINTEITIRRTAEHRGHEKGMKKGFQQGMQQGIQQGIQQGLQQGLQKGIQHGAHENAVKNAMSFLAMNVLTIEQIAQGTGLSVEEVEEIAKSMKK